MFRASLAASGLVAFLGCGLLLDWGLEQGGGLRGVGLVGQGRRLDNAAPSVSERAATAASFANSPFQPNLGTATNATFEATPAVVAVNTVSPGAGSAAIALATVLGKPIEETISQIIASRGQAPAVWVETFNFHSMPLQTWVTHRLNDGDVVGIYAQRDFALPPNSVGFRLACKGSWWKAITLHKGNSYLWEVVSVQDSPGQWDSGSLRVLDFMNNIVLSKAKAFGVHTNMHLLYDSENMLVGHTYSFWWEKD